MGWMRTILLGDFGNRLDIADNEQRIARIKSDQLRKNRAKASKDQSQDQAIADLRAEVGQLEMALSTMVTLLISKGVVTSEEVGHLVDAIESGDEEAN